MRTPDFLRAATVVACLGLTSAWPAAADIVATTAADVCSPAADPCNVTQRVEITANATLDFGLRTLALSGAGELDFLNRSATVLAGPIVLGGNGVSGASNGNGANISIKARRGCSGAPQRPCLSARACALGACSASFKCARDVTVSCASNADCALGTCSVGTGALDVNAVVDGKAVSPGYISLESAGDLTVNSVIDTSGTAIDSDGGSVVLDAGVGSVIVKAAVKAGGGGNGSGGSVDLTAGTDVVTSALIDTTGGDSDGGAVSGSAGRDLLVSFNINASAVSGGGYGGDIDLMADRDLSISGTSSVTTSLFALGHKTDVLPISSGDGGSISLYAGRNLSVARYGYAISRGASPEGYGGDIDISADGALVLAGTVRSNADGNQGDGGSVSLSGGASFTTTDTAVVEVDGGNGGYVAVTADGPILLGGSFLLGARPTGGQAGDMSVSTTGDAVVTGSVSALRQRGSVDFEACRLTLQSTAKIYNYTSGGENTLISRESMKLLPNSSVTTKADGTNRLIYRSPAKPPVRQGTITPAPLLVLDENLVGCPVCGNAEVDQTETCDDGDTQSGDGCSSDCQLESCIAQTVGGYPANPLCFDANNCTADTCNTQTGNCQHVIDCGDGVPCTVDSCSANTCIHTPTASLCNDGDFCDGDEVCDPVLGCGEGLPRNCNDSIACTTDSCSTAAGACVHTPDDAMCSDGVFCNGDEKCSPSTGCAGGSRNCSDNVSCTADACVEASDSCSHAPDDAACEDDDPCTTNSCNAVSGCVSEPSGLPGCTTTTTVPAVLCGDANKNGTVQASDALMALRTAVGSAQCEEWICDVNDDGGVKASDALAILKYAVGQPIELHCPLP